MNDVDDSSSATSRRHVRFGFGALFFFAALGLVLESLHGFKVGWYLDVTHGTRRHMLTLAHVHGTLLALINIAWAVAAVPAGRDARRTASASSALTAATLLMPAGFLLGGLQIHGGDPGLGIILVPVGAIALLVAIGLTVMNLER